MIENDEVVSVMRGLWFRYVEVWRASGLSLRRSAIEPVEIARQRAQERANQHGADGSGAEEYTDAATSSRRRKKAAKPKKPRPPKGPNNEEEEEAKMEIKPSDELFVPPSKPLLLGFVNLACRIVRSWVIPGDIVRWCQNGALPILNLWKSPFLTDLDRSKLTEAGKAWRKVFTKQYFTAHHLPTVSNISFQTYVLANMLKVPVSPLNAPLIARRIVNAMGLPEDVWFLYTRLARMHRALELPPDRVRPYKEHYAENIIVALLVASKLTPGWTRWIVKRDISAKTEGAEAAAPSRDGLIASSAYVRGYIDQPLSVQQSDLLMRRDLSRFVAQVEREALLSSKGTQLAAGGSWAYNTEVGAIFSHSNSSSASEPIFNSQQSVLDRNDTELAALSLPKGYAKHYLTVPISTTIAAQDDVGEGEEEEMEDSQATITARAVGGNSDGQSSRVNKKKKRRGKQSDVPKRKYVRRTFEVSGIDDPDAIVVGSTPHVPSVFYTPSLAATALPRAEQAGAVANDANIVCSYLVDLLETSNKDNSSSFEYPPNPEYTLLLERFAKYSCIPPGHLHRLLIKLETKLLKLPGVILNDIEVDTRNLSINTQGMSGHDASAPGSAAALLGSDTVPRSPISLPSAMNTAYEPSEDTLDAAAMDGTGRRGQVALRRASDYNRHTQQQDAQSDRSSNDTLSQGPFTQESGTVSEYIIEEGAMNTNDDPSDSESASAIDSSSEEDAGYLTSSSDE